MDDEARRLLEDALSGVAHLNDVFSGWRRFWYHNAPDWVLDAIMRPPQEPPRGWHIDIEPTELGPWEGRDPL